MITINILRKEAKSRESRRLHYASHRDEMIAKNKRYREKHRNELSRNQRRYAANNAEDVLDRLIQRKFGLSLHEYQLLLEAQGGGCAVCGNTCKSGRRLAIDHDHVTGKVRGLLCSKCNIAIGQINDDPGIARKIAEYLEKIR